jgi:GntR family transcriptional regulator / MocR family aminotransferase
VKHSPQSIPVADRQTTSLADCVITEKTINFDSGLPALDLFPRERWNRAVSHAFLNAPVSALGYDDPQGRPEFRSVLCAYLYNALPSIPYGKDFAVAAED